MNMNPGFPTDYKSILQRIETINPVQYGRTRNFVNGQVTYLSPYISRGVISTRTILNLLIEKQYRYNQAETLVKELAWRDYFQRVWQQKNIDEDIRQPQHGVNNYETPEAIIKASTGIKGIDNAIETLYGSGYMHNHCRMYTASIACNIAGSHWRNPANWMYYHLLDGDWASNACSWQWVAGSNSHKKYYANQENISRFTNTALQESFLNVPYEQLTEMETPDLLKQLNTFREHTVLPQTAPVVLQKNLPLLIYNYYNLDPNWQIDEPANRVLLLEPSVFSKYPVSQKCINFALALARNVEGIQVFTGEFEELMEVAENPHCHYKEHPLNKHYRGTMHSRQWINENVTGYFPSFSAYWKRLEGPIKKQFSQ